MIWEMSPPANTNFVFNAGANIGSTAASQGAFTGVFQNRWMPSVDASWIRGKHTFTFGGSFSYTQLNARDQRTNTGMIGFTDFARFLTGNPITYTADGFITTNFLQGDANRYYRSKETGGYIQDKYQIRPNLSVTAGLRFDYHGGLTEKNGRIFNFDPSQYSYDAATDTITSNGLIIAGNNPALSHQRRQRFDADGTAMGSRAAHRHRLEPEDVQRQDRGSLGLGLVLRSRRTLRLPFSRLCIGRDHGRSIRRESDSSVGEFANLQPIRLHVTCSDFANPWGPTLGPAPSGNPKDLILPNAAVSSTGMPLFAFADYNRANKLPYTMNQTLDIQWQPRNDLVIQVGYVGNLGRHEVVPLPFNQARIASPTHPIRPGTPFEQDYTYGYSILSDPSTFTPAHPAERAAVPANF